MAAGLKRQRPQKGVLLIWTAAASSAASSSSGECASSSTYHASWLVVSVCYFGAYMGVGEWVVSNQP